MATLGAAALMGGSSLLGGITGGKGASAAAKAQAQTQQQALAQNEHQFDVTQQNLGNYINAGDAATDQVRRALGLGDSATGTASNPYTAQQQQAGFEAGVKTDPTFTGAYNTGVDTILQNAAATGGLRGGNTQSSLAQFGSQLYSQVLQQQIQNLMGLSTQGAGAASGLGQISQNNSNANSQIFGNIGNANGTAAAAPYAGASQAAGGITAALQKYFSGGSGPSIDSAGNISAANQAIAAAIAANPIKLSSYGY